MGARGRQRHLGPGGIIASYAWDVQGGGFQTDPVFVAMRALGLEPPSPPNASAAGLRASSDLWTAAGLRDVATRQITVERTFTDFEDYWARASSRRRSVRASRRWRPRWRRH